MVFHDYWTCDDCQSPHYGMCEQCGKCGRKFEGTECVNIEDYPPSEED